MNGLYFYNSGIPGSVPQATTYINLPAPNLYDVAIGDITTWYATNPVGGYDNIALIDLGPSPAQSIIGARVNFTNTTSATLYASNSITAVSFVSIGTLANGVLSTFAASAYRYWQLVVIPNGVGGGQGSGVLSDFRIQAADGTYVVGVTSLATPDFTLTPGTQTITVQNSAGTVNIIPDITVNALNGFASAVSLAVTGQPAGLTATLSTASLSPGSSANIGLTAVGVTAGTYALAVTGTSGSLVHTQIINVTITAASTIPNAPTGLTATLIYV